GGNDPEFIGPAINSELVAVPSFGCPWLVDDGCALVERPTTVAVQGANEFLEPGVPMVLTDGALQLTAMLGYARERALVDRTCAEGSTRLDYDIDFVVIVEPS